MQPKARVRQVAYHVYILRCADGSLYAGITTDLDRRIAEHNSDDSKLGSKYVRTRRPAVLAWSRRFKDRSSASVEEARIKRLDRAGKLALIESIG
jgi:putative endonuclease